MSFLLSNFEIHEESNCLTVCDADFPECSHPGSDREFIAPDPFSALRRQLRQKPTQPKSVGTEEYAYGTDHQAGARAKQ